jgi:hypothetical protein
VLTAHENFAYVLVDGFLTVAGRWDVLYDDCVVRALGWHFAFGVEKSRILQNISNAFGL